MNIGVGMNIGMNIQATTDAHARGPSCSLNIAAVLGGRLPHRIGSGGLGCMRCWCTASILYQAHENSEIVYSMINVRWGLGVTPW